MRCVTGFNVRLWCACIAVSDGLELRPKYNSIVHCMKSVWQQEGLRGLYQGVTPNIWGAGASWGLYFFLYVCSKLQTCWSIVRLNFVCNSNMCNCPNYLPLQLQCNQRLHKGRSANWTECHGAPGVCSRSRLEPHLSKHCWHTRTLCSVLRVNNSSQMILLWAGWPQPTAGRYKLVHQASVHFSPSGSHGSISWWPN